MLSEMLIEERIAELEKGLAERGNQVVQADGQCIAYLNQIQAYKAVLSPAPEVSNGELVESPTTEEAQ